VPTFFDPLYFIYIALLDTGTLTVAFVFLVRYKVTMQTDTENKAKQNYIAGLKAYHKDLTDVVEKNYGVKTQYLEVISWGYHTTALYLKTADNEEYLIKLANWSEEKEKLVLKDIKLSQDLKFVIPTPVYIPNHSGRYITRHQNKILRLSHYISGLAPLDMNYDILGQMVGVLKKIHSFNILHGDLTPHNVLVSYGKLVAVTDFELSFEGPNEYDLARTSVFSWNYFKDENFENVAKFVLEKYADEKIDPDLFYRLCVENARKHLDAVRNHHQDYGFEQDWERDHDFAKKQLEKLTTLFKS